MSLKTFLWHVDDWRADPLALNIKKISLLKDCG